MKDEQGEVFRLPGFINDMVKKGLLGNKTGQGFFKKEKGEDGSKYFYYDYKSGQYTPSVRPKFASAETAKPLDDPGKRLETVLAGADKGALFAWKNLRDTLIYAFNRVPEIADDIVNIDNAMKWGFNWDLGPFEMLDAIGVKNFVKRAEQEKVDVPAGLKSIEGFYKFENNKYYYFDIVAGEYREGGLTPASADSGYAARVHAQFARNGAIMSLLFRYQEDAAKPHCSAASSVFEIRIQ